MIKLASRTVARFAAADRRLDARLSRRGQGDPARSGGRREDGFVLLETLVAISLISVIMAAFTTFFVNSVANVNQQRSTQTATMLADSAVDLMRSLPPSDLVVGNTPSSQTVNNVVYSLNSALSACPVTTTTDSVCGNPAPSGAVLLAVVTVTWPGARCLCKYVTSTLIDKDSDPVFNLNPIPPSVPQVSVADQVSTVGETITPLQLTVVANSGVPAYTWTLSSSTPLPPGLGLSMNGLISGVATAVTPKAPVTVTVTDGLGRKATSTFYWTVVAAPTIITPANQTTTINTSVTLTVASTCPNTPCKFTIVNAPTGLTINPATGVISGTPTIPGTVTVTVTVTDNDGQPATTAPFTWAVLSPASVCVPTIALQNGGFESPVRSPGADTNFLQGGSTPLLWDTTETDNFVELWRNGGNAQALNGDRPISAEEGAQWAELNANDVGALYQDLNSVPGQVLQWSVYHRARGVNGAPNGIDVMQVQIGSTTSQSPQVPTGQSTPNISDDTTAWNHYTGIYIVPAGQTTTRFQFAAISTSSGDKTIGNFIDNLSLNNNIACLSSPATDQASTVNTPIAPLSISVDRGTGPFTWGGGGTLPPGLTLTTDGSITGTPTAIGVTSVVLTLKDATDFAQTVSFKWTVYPKPTVTAPANQTHSVGSAVSLLLTSSCPDAPCVYTLNNGPSGLTISPAGVVTGTVTGSPQVFNAATITVTDKAGFSANTASFTWTVLAAPTVTTPATQTTTVGATVSLAVTKTCPNSPCTYALANAPAGLTINSSGTITGSPTSVGSTTTAAVTVTDKSNVSVTTSNFTWNVVGAPTVTTPPTQTMIVGTSVSLAVGYTCANGPCTFTLANAPAGLSITGAGVITGSPTTVGSPSTVRVTVTDQSLVSATTASFTINVIAPPSAPNSPAAAAGNAQIVVSWTAPSTNNGSAITGYTATSSPGGASCTPSPATATTCTITGLTNGTAYSVTVTATNAAGTGPPSSAVSATPGPTCTSVAVGMSAYLAYPFNETGGLTAADVSGNARPGTYSSTGITYGAAGPCPRDGAKAVTLGSSSGAIFSTVAPANPQVLSEAIWFKTTVAGGLLIGLGSSKTGLSSHYDRNIYMTNAGTLAFGVYVNANKTITTSLAYNDGKWHQAIATVAPSTDANPGIRLYVDGKPVITDTTTTTAEPDAGPSYWRIGYDNINGWPGAPSNYFFTGSLAFAATYSYAFTPAQALAQYNAGI